MQDSGNDNKDKTPMLGVCSEKKKKIEVYNSWLLYDISSCVVIDTITELPVFNERYLNIAFCTQKGL